MKSTVSKSSQNQSGMTLIEIMIALLIGAFLIGGIIQMFVNARQTYRMQDNLSRLQENGRFAMDFLGRDIRNTSYWGCLSKAAGDIQGFDNDSTNASIDDGTDSIILRAAYASTPTGNCGTTVDTTLGYYTSNTSQINYYVQGSVLRRNTGGLNQDLIEGVENMQIVYGEDTDADGRANYYATAANVVNMENVVCIRVNLVIRSLNDFITSQALPYTLNEVQITPTDRRIRRVFTSTFALRNRLP
jgi:type IV pilus assembly protein PilW